MRDPQAVISHVRHGSAPPAWRVFTKKRGAVGAFFRGTRNDPDPLLVVTRDGVVEYVSDKNPLAVVAFGDLAGVQLRVSASSMSDSSIVNLQIWLDLTYRNGNKVKWHSVSFKNNLPVMQGVIEGMAVHQALGGAAF